MRKPAFLLIFSNILLGAISLHAQIVNGSFTEGTNGFDGWTLLGVPAVVDTVPLPPFGLTAAQIQSTDTGTTSGAASSSNSVSAAEIDTTLGVTLPQTSGSNPTQEFGYFSATTGEAIYQTFTLSDAGTLSFDYSYQTNDYHPFDSVGFVLNGTYTELVATPAYTGSTISTLTPYTNYSIDLAPGTYTVAFVAYNTNDTYSSTSLFVTDVTVPEPMAWMLILAGLGALALTLRLKSRTA